VVNLLYIFLWWAAFVIFGGGCSPGSGGSIALLTSVQCGGDLMVDDSEELAAMVGDFAVKKHVRARECVMVSHHNEMFILTRWVDCILTIKTR
jgi:hypothetical protein